MINGYRLKQYASGNTRFSYRARADLGNLHEGKNVFELVFEYVDGRKVSQGNAIIFVISNDDDRKKTELQWATEQRTSSGSLGSTTSLMNPRSNPDLLAVQKLPEGRFYNEKNEPFTLRIATATRPTRLVDYFSHIKSDLEKAGIVVISDELDQESVSKLANEGVKNYDVFLGGIHLGILADNIFPFFFSGQSAKGYNFSRIKNPRLDGLLGLMRNTILTTEKEGWEQEIRSILSDEAAIVPLFRTPYMVLIDQNINNEATLAIIPDFSFLTQLTSRSYVREEYSINFEKKSLRNYGAWMRTSIINALALFY
jgi:hypothetical protein